MIVCLRWVHTSRLIDPLMTKGRDFNCLFWSSDCLIVLQKQLWPLTCQIELFFTNYGYTMPTLLLLYSRKFGGKLTLAIFSKLPSLIPLKWHRFLSTIVDKTTKHKFHYTVSWWKSHQICLTVNIPSIYLVHYRINCGSKQEYRHACIKQPILLSDMHPLIPLY